LQAKVKVFVINLKSAIERKKSIEKQLKGSGFDYEILEAVEGKTISPDQNPEIDWEYAHKNSYWISKGLLACTLSHLNAYRAILDQGLPYGLVLEDDTVLHPDLERILPTIGEKLHENEVLMLYYAAWEKCLLSAKDSVESALNKYKIVTPLNPRQLISANAYIITREACASILKFQTPMKTTSDSWGVYYDNAAISHLRCVYPMLADTADFKSTIDYVATVSIAGHILKFIDQYKIFPLYQILKKRRSMLRRKMLNIELVDK
jgi:glycosyl transferase, family 25